MLLKDSFEYKNTFEYKNLSPFLLLPIHTHTHIDHVYIIYICMLEIAFPFKLIVYFKRKKLFLNYLGIPEKNKQLHKVSAF